MTSDFWINWAVMTVSLFNTLVLAWLGLTVLLNAERRGWGIWMAGGGLLLGAAFFVSHSAIVGQGIRTINAGMNFWWYVGWIPVLALPFAWHTVILWYAGFTRPQNFKNPETRRQSLLFLLTAFMTVGLFGLFIFANPLPSYTQVALLDLEDTPSLAGIPILGLAYPLYSTLSIGFSLDILRRPSPTGRVMGELARRRARPWLIAAGLVLLVVSLLVAGVMLWILQNARQRTLYNLYYEMESVIALFDLVIATLIGVVTLLVGQAITSYEIFTGKSLPRRGLQRQWYNMLLLATGYSMIVSWALIYQLKPVYSLLLSALLLVGFYALYSWRSYVERERYIEDLRPFVASQRLYESLLTETNASPFVETQPLFQTLCSQVLGARVAYLAALGPLSPLVGPPLAYPPDSNSEQLPALNEITAQFDSPQTMCVPIDPAHYNGALWAIPLWSERGLIGAFLLGEKRDGSLYTQEEIEIARASGERLIDTQASAEMAQRLMGLQRQRLMESQLLDRRTRRVLHDEVLPLLHTSMLSLSASDPGAEVLTALADAHRQISNLLRDLPPTAAPKVTQLGLIQALQKMLNEELGSAFDSVRWEIHPEARERANEVPLLAAEVLFYASREALRNAARYARQPDRPLQIEIRLSWHNGLEIVIEDNGPGLSASRPARSGSGQGLALHSTLMAVVGGSLTTESVPGSYTRICLILPQTERKPTAHV
jgi:signal transduction histidine kinase